MATALVPSRRTCENCSQPLIPYGADACWACGGPSKLVRTGADESSRAIELVSLGGAIGGGAAYLLYETNGMAVLGAAIGAAVFAVVAAGRYVVMRGRNRRRLAAGDPLLALAPGTPAADADRARIDAIERAAVAFLGDVDAGLRTNRDAVAVRGSTSNALDHARTTLELVRARYEEHLANTLVASEAVAVAAWLRRMTALASLAATEPDQSRAVIARFDRDVVEARDLGFPKRARVAPSPDPTIAMVVRSGYPALGVRTEVAALLPPRWTELWDRALAAAAPLRGTLVDQLERAAVHAAAEVAGRARLIDNPDQPQLALTAAAPVLGSLESEVARLVEEAERIQAEAEALHEVEATLAKG